MKNRLHPFPNMRFSKPALFAAASLLVPAVLSANMDPPLSLAGNYFFTNEPDSYRAYGSSLNTPATSSFNIVDAKSGSAIAGPGGNSVLPNPVGSAMIVVDKGVTLKLDSGYSSTFSGMFFGEGNIVKNGTGSLQYSGATMANTYTFSLLDTTHPSYGYFANASAGAVYAYEMDPRGVMFSDYNVYGGGGAGGTSSAYALRDFTNVPDNYWEVYVPNLGGTDYVSYLQGGPMGPLSMRFRVDHKFGPFIANPTSAISPQNLDLVRLYYNDIESARVYSQYGGNQLGNEPYAKLLTNTGLFRIKYSDDPSSPEYLKNWRLDPSSDATQGDNYVPPYHFFRQQNADGSYSYMPLENWRYPVGTVFYNMTDSYNTNDADSYIGPSLAFGGLSGTVTINAGELDMRGYLNHWREFPLAIGVTAGWSYDAAQFGATKPMMVGARNWVLSGSAKLSFRNTDMNTTNATLTLIPPYDGTDTPAHPDPHTPNIVALNFVHNLQTGQKSAETLVYTTQTAGWEVRIDPASGLPVDARVQEILDAGQSITLQDVASIGSVGRPFIYDWVTHNEEHTVDIYSNDQPNTELEVGTNATGHRIIIHQDIYWDGSIGIISGSGRAYKTGPGSLTILNKARLDGSIFVAGGQLILDSMAPASGTGAELLLGVDSVNLVGTDGSRGEYMTADLRKTLSPPPDWQWWLYEYKQAYVPDRDTGTNLETWLASVEIPARDANNDVIYKTDPDTGLVLLDPVTGDPVPQMVEKRYSIQKTVDKYAQLVIKQDQTIHNLQALFAEKSGAATVEAAIQAALKANPTEPYIAGQAYGTNIRIDNFKLSLQQDLDGIYRGSINGDWKSLPRDNEISGMLSNGIILNSSPVTSPTGERVWSDQSRRNVVASFHTYENALVLLEQKIARYKEVTGNNSAPYYDDLKAVLEKLGADAYGNPAQQALLRRLDPNSAYSFQLAQIVMDALPSGVPGVNITRINDLMQVATKLLGFTRDEYIQFTLGSETSRVTDFYEFLLDADNGNTALEALLGRDQIPEGERVTLVNEVMKGVFGLSRGRTDLEAAKDLLREGISLVGKNMEQGNSARYQAILNALNRGDVAGASRLFVAAGVLEKKGAGTLALLVEAANISELRIAEGVVLGNVQAFGYSTVKMSGGELRVLQNNSGTLNATIEGEPGSLLIFTTVGHITNASGQQMLVGADAAGTAFIRQPQTNFRGDVIIEEGVTVQLGASVDLDGVEQPERLNESFSNANSFVLRGGNSQRETTLAINGSDQKIRNLSGDKCASIRLGTGVLVLVQEYDQNFAGKIYGEGSIVKEGNGAFALSGVSDFYGTAIVRAGGLSLNAENSLARAAALILKGGAKVSTNSFPQRIGALFGEAGSILDIGSGGLTVGVGDERLAQLRYDNDHSATGILNMNYLATRYVDGDGDATPIAGLKEPGGINDFIFKEGDQSSRAARGTTVGYLMSPLVDLSNAVDLAFSGEIQGTGDLVKIGVERLTIDGKNPNFTGVTRLDQGLLRVTADSLNSSSILINTKPNSSDYLELYAAASTSAARTGLISGTGDLHKIGQGEATLGPISYTGSTFVDQGRLVVADISGLPVADERNNPGGGIHVRNTGTIVFSYAGSAPTRYEGLVNGTGGVEKTGTGKVTLAGNLNYGHVEALISGAREFYSISASLPTGSIVNSDGTLSLCFPEGSRLLADGSVEVGGFGGEIFKPRNVTGLSEVEAVTGVFLVQAKPDGCVIRTRDADGNLVIIPLPAGVTAAPAGSQLRENGVIVLPDGTRLGTHGGVLNVGNSWSDVWLDGQRIGGFTYLYAADGTTPLYQVKYQRAKDPATGVWSWVVGDDGRRVPVLDDGGNPVYVTDSQGGRLQDYAVEVDPVTGLPLLDANGDMLPLHTGVTLLVDPEALLLGERIKDGVTQPWLSQDDRVVIASPDGSLRAVSNGATVVRAGELEIQELPRLEGTAPGELEVLRDATLTVNLVTAAGGVPQGQTLESVLRGDGTFCKTGAGTLLLNSRQPLFTGTFKVSGGAVNLGAENALDNSRDVVLESGAVLNLDGRTQTFHYLAGTVDSTVNVNGSRLLFEVPANEGEARLYEGRFAGGGTLVKTGAGRLSLWRPADAADGAPNVLENIRVEAGSLQASPTALGNANVHVANGSELDFYTKAGEYQAYSGALSGVGVIGKEGAGTVCLQGDKSLLDIPEGATQFLVREGRLIVENSRIAQEEGRAAVPGARVKTGAVFQLDLKAEEYLTLGANTVVDYAEGEHGSFAIHGPTGTELTINGTPLGYTGVTELVGGLKLTFDLDRDLYGQDGIATLVGGLSAPKAAEGEEAPIVNLGGSQSKVVLVQNLEGNFWGDFSGYALGALDGSRTNYGPSSAVTISGPEKLIYRGGDGRGILPEGKYGEQNHAQIGLGELDVFGRGVGNVTVDGGRFQVGVENCHAIDVINNGILYVANYGTADTAYRGLITNSNQSDFGLCFLAGVEGAGAISITPGIFEQLSRFLPRMTAEAGSRLVLEASPGAGEGARDLNTSFRVDALEVAAGATLEVRVAPNPLAPLAALELNTPVTGGGSLLKTGEGRLSINADQPYAGETRVMGGTLGGNFTVTGDLVVDAGGTLAPGNSIGTVGTLGNLVLNAGGLLDIEIEGTSRDRILVGGKIVLNGGTIRLTGLTRDIERGALLSIAESRTSGGRLGLEYNAIPTIESGLLDVPNSNENFILLGPGIGKGTPYEGLVDKRTGVNAADSLAVLVAQKEIAKIPGFDARPGMGAFYSALDSLAVLPVPPVSESTADEAFRSWYDRNRSELSGLGLLPRDRASARLAEIVRDLRGGLPASVRPDRNDPGYKAAYDWLKAAYLIGSYVNTTSLEELGALASNLSPLGFASLAAMPAAFANSSVDNIRARAEQRRYDADVVNDYGAFRHPWQIYFSANATIHRSGGESGATPYNFNSEGASVGADARFGKSSLLGAVVEYANGSANLKSGSGRNRMNAVRGTAYASTMLDQNGWFYLDGGASAGYNSYSMRRNVVGVAANGDTDGWSAGLFASLGTGFVLCKGENAEDFQFHLTPAITLEYNHHAVNSFTEGANDGGVPAVALRVNGFDLDSMRLKIGTGFQFTWGENDSRWRVALDVSYARELLDTDAEISSRFALDPYGTTRSTVKSRALPQDFVQAAPSVTWNFTEQASVFASYRYEASFDGDTRHNLTAGFRYRF
ncbi:MAG: autotransporter domain-containing protein [Puniceicoccales bacterium]|jgi:outer membrane autotransporter protein|nr:autotransporter domain-containing protein [Puniceicoccales bacterium]